MNCELKKLDTILNLIDTNYFDKTTGILTIPEGVEVINGKFYFRRKNVAKLNRVKGIKIPNSVKKIGKYAFRKTGITSLELPKGVEEIELGAFELCCDLISVSIKGSRIPLIEKDSFMACENLERFANSNGDIDIKNDFRISNRAFSTCYKLINSQNKWLLVVPEEPSGIQKYVNKILGFLGKLLSFNGAESIRNKF